MPGRFNRLMIRQQSRGSRRRPCEDCQPVCYKISCWLHKWRSKANCAKIDPLVFYGSLDNSVLSGEKIHRQPQTKVLRITLDEKLSIDKQFRLSKYKYFLWYLPQKCLFYAQESKLPTSDHSGVVILTHSVRCS